MSVKAASSLWRLMVEAWRITRAAISFQTAGDIEKYLGEVLLGRAHLLQDVRSFHDVKVPTARLCPDRGLLGAQVAENLGILCTDDNRAELGGAYPSGRRVRYTSSMDDRALWVRGRAASPRESASHRHSS
jgi:hypothetical protein